MPCRLLLFDFCDLLVVADAGFIHAALHAGDVADSHLFTFPLLAEAGELFAQLVHLVFNFGEALFRVFFGFRFQLPGGELQLHEPSLHLVDFGRHALEFHREPAGGFVHQVDRFIRQEAIADVAVRELGGGDEGGVFDPHAFVMRFVTRLEAAENRDRIFDVGFADKDWLKPPLERGILFDVLAELVERCCTDAAELATGEGWLEQVRGVVATLGSAGADDGVQFVDEQDDVPGIGNFFDERFEPLFEFAAELCAGDERAHIERDDAAILETFRHVALENARAPGLRRSPFYRRPVRR